MTNYLGGKARLGKYIAEFITEHDPKHPGQSCYWEPFVGMCGSMRHMSHYCTRIGTDLHGDVIAMWKAVQGGKWKIPDKIGIRRFNELKNNPGKDKAEHGFAGHAITFNGRYFGTYNDDAKGTLCKRAQQNLLKCKELLDLMIHLNCLEKVGLLIVILLMPM